VRRAPRTDLSPEERESLGKSLFSDYISSPNVDEAVGTAQELEAPGFMPKLVQVRERGGGGGSGVGVGGGTELGLACLLVLVVARELPLAGAHPCLVHLQVSGRWISSTARVVADWAGEGV
jgi:hypothetical protein